MACALCCHAIQMGPAACVLPTSGLRPEDYLCTTNGALSSNSRRTCPQLFGAYGCERAIARAGLEQLNCFGCPLRKKGKGKGTAVQRVSSQSRPAGVRASNSDKNVSNEAEAASVSGRPVETSERPSQESSNQANPRPTSLTEFIMWGGNLPSRRRLLYSGVTGLAVTLGGNLGGVTSGLLGLNAEASRQLKLDTLFPVKGFKRCIESGQGFGELHSSRI